MTESALNDLKWKKVPIGSGGFVCLVDVMGDDSSVVQAARVSYGAGTKTVSDDSGLIRYLMRHQHTTPFEMAELKFLVRVPMDTWRQWIRHRTASVNEYSTRYSEAIDERQTTKPDEWRIQSSTNRQGSANDVVVSGANLSIAELALHVNTVHTYRERLEAGVAREQARKDLPLSTYTEAYWKIDLHNLLHFLRLRMDSHAQLEIRQYANAIGNIVSQLFPITWKAFEDYRINAITLTALEIESIKNFAALKGLSAADDTIAAAVDWIDNKREREEATAKLKRLLQERS
jgi:thymidylate synthase (FAD)